MKQQKYTWKNAAKEVLKEFIIAVIVLALCGIALMIGLLLPRELLSRLPFELLLFLAVVAVGAILYVISAVVAIVAKIKTKLDKHKTEAD